MQKLLELLVGKDKDPDDHQDKHRHNESRQLEGQGIKVHYLLVGFPQALPPGMLFE
jgi:hypothetical protein